MLLRAGCMPGVIKNSQLALRILSHLLTQNTALSSGSPQGHSRGFILAAGTGICRKGRCRGQDEVDGISEVGRNSPAGSGQRLALLSIQQLPNTRYSQKNLVCN